MKFASIGTPVPSASKAIETKSIEHQRGFTLIEALVALAVLVAFVGALTPLMFQGHRILSRGNGAVQAEIVLKALLDSPVERNNPVMGLQEGESNGLQWRMKVEPYAGILPTETAKTADPQKPSHHWSLLHIKAEVFWRGGKRMEGETLRLAEFN